MANYVIVTRSCGETGVNMATNLKEAHKLLEAIQVQALGSISEGVEVHANDMPTYSELVATFKDRAKYKNLTKNYSIEATDHDFTVEVMVVCMMVTNEYLGL